MPHLSLGLVGPRRTRQGLGPFLARFAEAHGARVVAVCGRDIEAARHGAHELAAALGHELRPYAEVSGMLEAESGREAGLSGLIIASPHPTHAGALHAALAAGVPVLCEKPLLDLQTPALVRVAEALVAGFAAAGLTLVENCQWPFAIPAWQGLFPRFRIDEAGRFRCRLSPVSTGPAQIPDAMPHALSLLQALRPSAADQLEDLRIERLDDAWTAQDLHFRWPGDRGSLDCLVELRQVPETPRPFGFGLDDAFAERSVDLPGYSMSLTAAAETVAAFGGPAEGRVPLEDPLGLLVRDFVSRLGRGGRVQTEVAMLQRLRMLGQCRETAGRTKTP